MMTSQISQAMLMAAGLGTRLRPFTEHKTKALLPLMGIPMAQFAVDSLAFSGVNLVVANVHHDAERTQKGIQNLELPFGKVLISDESKVLLGSAGGIRKALSNFGQQPFFLSNADVLCDVDWAQLALQHARLRSRWGVKLTLAIFESGPVGGSYREVFFDSQKQLITGLGQLQIQRPFFIGAAVLEPEAFVGIQEGEVSDLVEKVFIPCIQEKKAGVFISQGSWYDIGSPAFWQNAHLSMIHRLESGDFRSRISKLWSKKISQVNQRLSERTWISRGSPRPKYSIAFKGPLYWDGRDVESKDAPTDLGPNSILYGKSTQKQGLQNGIGYAGAWAAS